MIVEELIARLKKENPKAEVLLASDEEGNAYSTMNWCFGKGNFDEEEKSPFSTKNSMYCCDVDDLKGDYIIFYPN